MTTLAIGLAIQPALDRIERSELPHLFQVVFGISATVLLVVLLVKLDLPIHGSLVLTGSPLRFLPGAALVAGMHDLISGTFTSGLARLAEVLLTGVAIAGAASLVLAFGENIDVQLRITTVGRTDWPDLVILLAGSVAVACYACRVGVPRPRLPSVIAVGALAVVVAQGLTPVSADLSREGRTLIAALLIGILGRMLAHRSAAPAALWMAPPLPRHAPTALDRSALPRPRHPQRNRRHHAGRSVDPG